MVPYPNLTPSGFAELYFGYSFTPNDASAGTTPGFTYALTAGQAMVSYDPNVSSAVSPTASQLPAAQSAAAAVLLTVSNSSGGPTVTGVSPNLGHSTGGASVTIKGTNLTGATAVKFGTVPATAYTVNSATQITATAPAQSAATVDVTVTTSAGTSVTSSADHFTYSTTSAIITSVGSLATADGSGLTTLSVDPQTAGDVLAIFAQNGSTLVGTLSSVSGGGVTTWTKAVQYTSSVFGGSGDDLEIWYGKVTTTGSSTITFTWSGTTSGHILEYGAQEFTAGLGSVTAWTLDTTGITNGTSSSSVPLPQPHAQQLGRAVLRLRLADNTASAGSTSGFTYAVTAEGNVIAFDTSVSSAVSPTAGQSPAGVSSAVAVSLSAFNPSRDPYRDCHQPEFRDLRRGNVGRHHRDEFTGATAVKFGPGGHELHGQQRDLHHRHRPVRFQRGGRRHRDRPGRAHHQRLLQHPRRALLRGVAQRQRRECHLPGLRASRRRRHEHLVLRRRRQRRPVPSMPTATRRATPTTPTTTRPRSPTRSSNVTKTTYDADDRVVERHERLRHPSATTTTYTYDIAPGSCPSAPTGTTYCTQVENGLSQTTTSYYNALDQMIEQAAPNTTAQTPTTYTYDGVGNVLTKTDGSGTATYTYDADNRVTGITYSSTASGYTEPQP